MESTFQKVFNETTQASARSLKQRFNARMELATAMTRLLKEKGRDHQVVSLLEENHHWAEKWPEDAKPFFEDLWAELVEHEGVTHPFLRRFSEASLTTDQIRLFGAQYYQHAKMFLHYLAYVIPGMPTEDAQFILMENLVDEYGSFDPNWVHPAVFRSFLTALGLTRSDWEGVKPIREVSLYIDRHLYICRFGDPLTACGALALGTEWFVPLMFSQIVKGLNKVQNMNDEALTYWRAHITLDVLHSYEAMRALAPFATDTKNRRKLREGALRSLDARKMLWDGMHRITFGTT